MKASKILRKFKYRCIPAFPGICTGVATQVHEIEPRSSGRGKLVFENQVATCIHCHDYITSRGSTNFMAELKEKRQDFLDKYVASNT